jgi:exopolysaccharide biosynthesis polyprenyl glycosylphosphotransferase
MTAVDVTVTADLQALPAQSLGTPAHATRAKPERSQRSRWEVRYVRSVMAADFFVVLLAGVVAYEVRFGWVVTDYMTSYIWLTAVLPVAWLAALALNHCYDTRFLFVGSDEYQRVFRAGIAMMATLAMVAYALNLPVARGYVIVAIPLATVACTAARFGLRKRLQSAHLQGRCLRRVIVVGYERAVIDLCRQLRRERYHGMEVVGACLPRPITERRDGRLIVRTPVDVPVLGTFMDVATAVERAGADTVIVLSCPEFDGTALRRLAWQLERDDTELIVASALLDIGGDRTTIRPVDGLPMLHLDHAKLRGARRVVKELFDRIGASLGLLLISPLLLAMVLAVKLNSPGPAMFRQVRVGRDGREFRIYKFRTMRIDAEAVMARMQHLNEHDGVLFKMRNDPRVTPVGRFLRRFSLDELPQLINVVRGEMSLVGPRPPLPSEVERYPFDMYRRLAVKPGLTGLWQVSGRSDLPWEEVVRLDLRYVESWSLSLDLVILLRTITAVLRSSGAY